MTSFSEIRRKRVKVGTGRSGRTYWLDDTDHYVYQLKSDGRTWAGWLCAGSSWRYFRDQMAESIPVEDAESGRAGLEVMELVGARGQAGDFVEAGR